MAAKRRKAKGHHDSTVIGADATAALEPRAKAPRSRAFTFRRLAYWSLVVGIWGVIAIVGVLGLAALNLPPLESLPGKRHRVRPRHPKRSRRLKLEG